MVLVKKDGIWFFELYINSLEKFVKKKGYFFWKFLFGLDFN